MLLHTYKVCVATLAGDISYKLTVYGLPLRTRLVKAASSYHWIFAPADVKAGVASFSQIGVGSAAIGAAGAAVTVTSTVALSVQPFGSVTVTV